MQAFPHDFVLGEGGPRGHEDVWAALAPRYSVGPGPRPRTVRRTWLDTFDWRLHAAGLTLEHVTGRGPGELTLTGPGHVHIALRASGLRWPALPAALPAGPLRQRLAEAAGVRALMPVARGVGRLCSLRVCNADAKTVAWLTVDQTSVTAPAAAGLPARLSVTAVRGYQAQADRIAGLLAQLPEVAPAGLGQLETALAAAGRRPGDYTPKIDVELDAGMPARLAIAAVLLRLLGTLEANVAGTVRDIDTEFLHDLRVSVRRTRTALKLAGHVLPSGLAGEFRGEFKWLGDATTPTRDLDVYLLDYAGMEASLSATTPAELAPFHDFLARQRAVEQRRLVRALRSARFASLVSKWRVSITDLAPPRRGPTAARLAAEVLGKAHRRVLKRGKAITDDSPAESLHDLRKRCKELRYALEFFGSVSDPGAHRQAVRALKGLQDCLGTFQDCQVQQHEIRMVATEMAGAGGAQARALLAMGDLAAQLARRERKARGEFAGRFADFASAASRRRFRDLITDAES